MEFRFALSILQSKNSYEEGPLFIVRIHEKVENSPWTTTNMGYYATLDEANARYEELMLVLKIRKSSGILGGGL